MEPASIEPRILGEGEKKGGKKKEKKENIHEKRMNESTSHFGLF